MQDGSLEDGGQQYETPRRIDQTELQQQQTIAVQAMSSEILNLTEPCNPPSATDASADGTNDLEANVASQLSTAEATDGPPGQGDSDTDRLKSSKDDHRLDAEQQVKDNPAASNLSDPTEGQRVASTDKELLHEKDASKRSDDVVGVDAGGEGDSSPTEPGVVRVRGISASGAGVSVAMGSTRIPEAEVVAAGERPPEPARFSRAVTAKAISDEDIEMEVRERILREAVKAEVRSESYLPSNGEIGGTWRTRCYRWRWWILALVALIIIAIVVGTVVGVVLSRRPPPPPPPLGTSAPTANPTSQPTFMSTPPPTLSPTNTLLNAADLRTFLSNNSPDGGLALNAPDQNPAIQAYNQILDDPSRARMAMDDKMLDLYALLAMYYGFRGSFWTNSSGWATSAQVCDWYGVSCDSEGGVTSVSLRNNQLRGTFIPEIGILSSHTTSLDLSENTITADVSRGGIVALSSLSKLQYLNLSYNEINAPLVQADVLEKTTDVLASMVSIRMFDVSYNMLNGSLVESVEDLTNMTHFLVNNNNLSGAIPAGIAAWTKLEVGRFEGNNFTGAIPSTLCSRVLSNLLNLTVDCAVNCSCCGDCP